MIFIVSFKHIEIFVVVRLVKLSVKRNREQLKFNKY